jgi:molecular chaperone GrpE
MSDQPNSDDVTPDDFDLADLHPEDIALDPDFTSEMTRLRAIVEQEEAEAQAMAAEAAIEHDVDALLAERDSFKDIALRLQADFDNYRKRVATQQALDTQAATGKIAEALLPVLDACEAAFVQHPAEVEPLFNLLLGQLRKLGLETMNLDGQPFDPNLAEAVMHEPGDGEPVVSEVLRSGYTWQGKVLRAAMVKVRG